jgi:hypothetical protein
VDHIGKNEHFFFGRRQRAEGREKRQWVEGRDKRQKAAVKGPTYTKTSAGKAEGKCENVKMEYKAGPRRGRASSESTASF